VYDHDSITANDLIGEAFLNVKSLMLGKKAAMELPLGNGYNTTLIVRYNELS